MGYFIFLGVRYGATLSGSSRFGAAPTGRCYDIGSLYFAGSRCGAAPPWGSCCGAFFLFSGLALLCGSWWACASAWALLFFVFQSPLRGASGGGQRPAFVHLGPIWAVSDVV